MEFDEYTAIKHNLARNGHNKWGFVIFRCTYDSDTEWNSIMEKRKADDAEELSLGPYSGLQDGLLYTVIEDKATLDGASVDTVRKRFIEWQESHPERHEQPADGQGQNRTPRYRYCVMIDKAALKSIIEKPENEPFLSPEDTEATGYVYLIAHNDEVEEDESWMKVDFFSLTARWYDLVVDGWAREYVVPPGIAIG